jgi:hypothetical protein
MQNGVSGGGADEMGVAYVSPSPWRVLARWISGHCTAPIGFSREIRVGNESIHTSPLRSIPVLIEVALSRGTLHWEMKQPSRHGIKNTYLITSQLLWYVCVGV